MAVRKMNMLQPLAELERRYERLPDNVLAAFAAANREYASLSPRRRLTQYMLAWRQEIADRKVLLQILSIDIAKHRDWLDASEPGSDRRAIAENRHVTLGKTWRLHAHLLIRAARGERKARKELAAMRPVLVM